MKTLLCLILASLSTFAAVPPGGIRINFDTSGTNTISSQVTISGLTNVLAGRLLATNLTAARVLISEPSLKGITNSPVTSTELGYVAGVTSGIQAQIDAKAALTVGSAILKGNGLGGFADAVASTDYAPVTSGTAVLKANGSGGFANAVDGTDFLSPTTGVIIGRTITAGAGMSGGGDLSANRTVTWDPSSFINNVTLWDSSQASRTLTFGLSGATDPVATIGNNSFDISTGVLKQGGTAVTLQSRSISTGAGLSGGGDLSADRTLTWAPETQVNSISLFDGSQASRTITFGVTGTDPVATVSASSFDITTGTLKQGGTAVALQSRALTIAGTANEITSSAGSQDLSADRTWTLSLPSALTFTGKTITGGTFSSPSLTTPTLGVATATSINKWTLTAPTTAATLTAGGDNLTYTGPSSSQTLVGVTSTDTLQNKTTSTTWAGGNNTHTRRLYLPLQFTRVAAVSMIVNTNDPSLASYGRPRFPGNSTATNSNYAIYRAVVPIKFVGGSGQDLTMEKITYKTTGTQTGATNFDLGVLDIADSAAADPADSTAFGNYIRCTSGTLTSAAANDRFSTANVTLTGWRSALTAGHDMAVCIVRNDTNTDGMDLIDCVISYVETQ